VLTGPEDLTDAFDVPSVIEDKVDIAQEISVIVARSPSGAVRTFPTVEMVVSDVSNMLDYLLSPARISPAIEQQCIEIAESLATALDLVGLLAVELFVSQEGQVLINEIAPRPHNSGHHSIEANNTSQFEQHVRAVCDLPLGDTALKSPAVMVNLVGAEGYQGPVHYRGFDRILAMPDVYIHIYGKAETRPFRKMGHVTIVRPDINEAIDVAQRVKEEIQVIA
jgi:5-(carboxyamino)imidazole ribonucleotide synthase